MTKTKSTAPSPAKDFNLTPEERTKLTRLEAAIWDQSKAWAEEKRVLTDEEEAFVLALIQTRMLPCTLTAGPLGEPYLHVYEHTEVQGVPPQQIFVLGHRQVASIAKTTGVDAHLRFEYFSKITHTETNKKLLAFYRLPIPGPLGDYLY